MVQEMVSVKSFGMEYIDMTSKTVKVLGIYFSCNKKVENEEAVVKPEFPARNIFVQEMKITFSQ